MQSVATISVTDSRLTMQFTDIADAKACLERRLHWLAGRMAGVERVAVRVGPYQLMDEPLPPCASVTRSSTAHCLPEAVLSA